MKAFTRYAPAAALALAAAAFAAPAASAATSPQSAGGPGGAVFALTDSTAGNAVAAYHRAPNGTLTPAGSYRTGGVGGILPGSVVDHTASQGAVAYVLNALGGGSLHGYRVGGGGLESLSGSTRALGLGTTTASQFTATPGQVAFTPDGSRLLVTTKAASNAVDVFAVRPDGRLSAKPVVNALPAAVPFAVAFSGSGDVVLSEAGPNVVATFTLSRGGTLTPLASAATGQMATCWVTPVGSHVYASNAGSGTVSGYGVGRSGGLTALGNTKTDAGTVDGASAQGRFLYVQTGAAGVIDEFAVGHAGALSPIGSVTVPGAAGGEGIAAA